MESEFGDALKCDETRLDVRIRYVHIRLSESTWNGIASQDGKFVGKSLDSPLGVTGTWSLSDYSLNINLNWAYGSDPPPGRLSIAAQGWDEGVDGWP